jgi:hypothetical protein
MNMDNDPLPAMLFPLPSGTLLRQARADAPRGKVWTWLQALPQNDWGQALPERVKRLAEACRADPGKVRAYARLAAWNSGIFHTATGADSPGGINPDELLEYACTEPA